MIQMNRKKRLLATMIAALLGASMAGPVSANESTGTISGKISTATDPASYQVVIENESTGQVRSIGINDEGGFRIPSLQVGTYKLRITDASGTVQREREVRVSLGSNTRTNFDLANTEDVERISVVGHSIAMVDPTAVDTGLNINESEFDKLPVMRNSTSVALLAPTTTEGDTAFNDDGNLASFGGASVAENAYYINGLNVTNFRNGLGGSSVPFEFYKAFKVKTGGYSAEYGRSLGGVVDAVTKSGTNEFHGGANIFYSPDSLAEQPPNTHYRNGRVYFPNDEDERENTEANIWLSGPIIKDKLFFYGLYNPRDVKSRDLTKGGSAGTGGGENMRKKESDDAFWGVNVDWYITADHILELTAFSDSRDRDETSYAYDYENRRIIDDSPTVTTYSRGGDNYLAKYTGYITDNLTITALAGKNKYNLDEESNKANECAFVRDDRDVGSPGYTRRYPSCAGSDSTGITHSSDERDAYRLDIEWIVNDSHTLKFGYDLEKMKSKIDETLYAGGYYNLIDTLPNGSELPSDADYTNTTGEDIDYVDRRSRVQSGSFETEAVAYYVEDYWQITDDIYASIGVRNDAFKNKDANGDAFIDVDNQWAPRLGITWDVKGDGTSKLYANYGLYYLPIPNNTNVRVAGSEVYYSDYFRLDGMQSDGQPVLGEQLGGRNYYSRGTRPPEELADHDIEPMYQEEWILGYEQEIYPGWVAGIKGTHRDLKRAIDDSCSSAFNGGCVLINPGSGVDTVLDGQEVHYSSDDLGFDDAKRKYDALTFTLNHMSDDLTLGFSYTWSHLRGNTEGFVKSDNGQDDAGITQDWDMPELMDGAYGDLPNDRRHIFKFYGAYNVTEAWSVGWNFSLKSGRPINAFGAGYPTGRPSYGDTYYLTRYTYDDNGDVADTDYIKVPRGTMGRTDWIARLDLSSTYELNFKYTDVRFYLNVFNVFDAHGSEEVYEYAETDPGALDERYGLTSSYQTPRSVQLGMEVTF